MSTKVSKEEIIRCGMARQQEIINDFRQGIRELELSIGSSGEAQMDNARIGANNEIKERMYMLGKQLTMVEQEMDILNQIAAQTGNHEDVHAGSVVITEHLNFFVSVSIEDFEAEGTKFFGISTKAPIYAQMMGKKKGDTFAFNGKLYTVQDLY